MKRFYIVTNAIKDPELQMTRMVNNYLTRELGRECVVEGLTPDGDDYGSTYRQAHITEDIDCVIVLGGDGTVLQAAWDALPHKTPILGINLGKMGYLAEASRNDWKEALSKLATDDYGIDERMMLEGVLVRKDGTTSKTHYALNDIVFNRVGPLRALNYEIYVNGQYLASWHADGVILATPTGSTAYNLSAGGPVVEPGARMILLTPICTHTINARSIVLAPDDIVEIGIGQMAKDSVPAAEVSYDGKAAAPVCNGDRVRIYTSEQVTRLVKVKERSFLETLRKKLNYI